MRSKENGTAGQDKKQGFSSGLGRVLGGLRRDRSESDRASEYTPPVVKLLAELQKHPVGTQIVMPVHLCGMVDVTIHVTGYLEYTNGDTTGQSGISLKLVGLPPYLHSAFCLA